MDWSQTEVDLIVSDYFDMLEKELSGVSYSKADHRRRIILRLSGRSDGSIEFKHQNISAVLTIMGLPYIKGYKPKHNFQTLLAEKVASHLSQNYPSYQKSFDHFSNSFTAKKRKIDFSKIIVEPPELKEFRHPEINFVPRQVNYLELEQRNQLLGQSGEEMIIEYEKWRLIKIGKEKLVDSIEWISKEVGDGAGYDILSKNENGTDRYIEVKTTKLAKETPVFISKKELEFSRQKAKDFYLYRLFNFDDNPKFFQKQGFIEDFCNLIPESYRGYF